MAIMKLHFHGNEAHTLWDAPELPVRWENSIGYEALCSLAKKPGRVVLIDRSGEQRHVIKAGMLLAVSALLAKHWKRIIPGKRVGVVLPPGVLGFFANLSLFLAGKIPVNLNFTAGRSSIQHAIDRAEIETILSVGALRSRLVDFPWTENVVDILTLVKSLPKSKIAAHLASVYVLPGPMLAKIWNVARLGGDKEAALLFTSGSDGAPKGVVLTHKNLLSNINQIFETRLLPSTERMMAVLPIFHSFGFTVTMIFPLVYPIEVVTYFTPLEVRKIGQIIHEEQVTVMIGAPTFLRPYMTRVEPYELASLKYTVGGAEKTPEGFHEAWIERFGSYYLEGYGLTETAPVVSANLPKHACREGGQELARRNTVGKALPGMKVRIVNPETAEVLPIGETGIVELAGPNIFAGYLGEPEKTSQILINGWLRTGDLGRLDQDGFLYIDGRLSRFSKIAGEMVPHGTIETGLSESYKVHNYEERTFAVTAIADETKGEALVLLTTKEVDVGEVREHMIERGFPNLWVPRHIVLVEKIPSLASGKLDLKGCKQLAEEMVSLKIASSMGD
jgi:acyl-[acyl-carrier-protein]-phospholipid O-acyltransferase / long-chain-fatty-acid--[acyl-carrier-protein] ligase